MNVSEEEKEGRRDVFYDQVEQGLTWGQGGGGGGLKITLGDFQWPLVVGSPLSTWLTWKVISRLRRSHAAEMDKG